MTLQTAACQVQFNTVSTDTFENTVSGQLKERKKEWHMKIMT